MLSSQFDLAEVSDCCEVRYMSTDVEIFGVYNTGGMTLVSLRITLKCHTAAET